VRALILGTLLGIVFGASSLYLVLKVGITVSASIPVAVISVALFRIWSKLGGRDATILENNMVQTAGSAGESIAFGLGVTMPAIMILGFDLEITRVMLVGLLGAWLGILMMIPLRRALIVAQHGQLKYPEGTACAEVLKAGADEESRSVAETAADRKKQTSEQVHERLDASTIFTGFGIGLIYKTMMEALRLWKNIPEKIFGGALKGGSISAEIAPELLGVGYIIGPRIGSIMMAGGVLNALVLIPIIKFFGDGLGAALAPGTAPISQMSLGDLRKFYILYIGAGAVTAGGIISLIRSMPLIVRGIRSGLSDFRAAAVSHVAALRTERDLSMKFVAAGIIALIIIILLAPTLHMNVLGALLLVLFGFIFVAVSSRLTGEIGSSSNPISGMTVATLLLTCLVFLAVGWTGGAYYVTALSVGGIVCVAASNGGSTSQDLKTGFLIGATPRFQQLAILIGSTGSALVIGSFLLGLNNWKTVYVPVEPGLRAPASDPLGRPEKLQGPQSKTDSNAYRVWHRADPAGGASQKYLVNAEGAAVWLVDPGINGTQTTRPDGSQVQKFDAPKATLMSYIIKGILHGQLPWGLVLFGVMIAVVLELCAVSSLAFAVGVYLPISASAPIFVGGAVRWLVDYFRSREANRQTASAEELAAESDRSPGVLLASGFIGGGAIAGIIVAFLQGVLISADHTIEGWAKAHNPFYAGANADWLALLPFAALTMFLYLVARKVVFSKMPSI
jgi:putative OPT family oligopeptide transporter